MRNARLCIAGALIASAPLAVCQAAAPQESVIYTFTNTAKGVRPAAGLIADSAGNLYGTTFTGEVGVDGAVFELSPPASGKTLWTMKELHHFDAAPRGRFPLTAVLSMDSSGNLYGTTPQGSRNDAGVAFKLTKPAGNGRWPETVLYHFKGTKDGGTSYGGIVFGPGGNLYGTTGFGGAAGAGTVFMLSPDSTQKSGWAETVLYSFTSGTDGGYPYSIPIFDAAGNLYGTTLNGGNAANGVVFELSPPTTGTAWTETVLHSFDSATDGISPRIGLTFDTKGNLYGTTENGGTYNWGIVYELSPPASGGTAWTESILHNFNFSTDGGNPGLSTLLFDKSGALYGTTEQGGTSKDGIIFKLTPPKNGGTSWTETTLHNFTGSPDGAEPQSGLIPGPNGTLIGTTYEGGNQYGYGTVYQLAP
jgi:uncharacterized repeat protein (TIGR03803 family)